MNEKALQAYDRNGGSFPYQCLHGQISASNSSIACIWAVTHSC